MALDITTPEGAEQWLRGLFPLFKQNLEKYGQLRPVAFILMTVNPLTGDKFRTPEVTVFPMQMGDNREKNAISEVLTRVVMASKAMGIAFISESWTAPFKTQEEVNRWVGNIANHPERKECVYVSFEHKAFPRKVRSFQANISRNKLKQPTLGEFEEHLGLKVKPQGRFCGFLDHEN